MFIVWKKHDAEDSPEAQQILISIITASDLHESSVKSDKTNHSINNWRRDGSLNKSLNDWKQDGSWKLDVKHVFFNIVTYQTWLYQTFASSNLRKLLIPKPECFGILGRFRYPFHHHVTRNSKPVREICPQSTKPPSWQMDWQNVQPLPWPSPGGRYVPLGRSTLYIGEMAGPHL